mgnify:CR=1 FL=1
MRAIAIAAALLALALPVGAAQDDKLTILAFGDSLVHGYGLPAGEPFPAQLQARLHEAGYDDVEVVNAGSSGDTSKSGRARLDWVLQGDVDAAIVVLGANDALRGIDPAVTRENLDAILATLDDKGIATLLAGMKAPRNMGAEYVEAFDGTGVQDVLESALFDVMGAMAIFPGSANGRSDSEGVFRDCFILPEESTTEDFAYHLHSDIGDGLLHGIDCRSNRQVGSDHELGHRDVVEIVTTN